jgi:hypothetical protein
MGLARPRGQTLLAEAAARVFANLPPSEPHVRASRCAGRLIHDTLPLPDTGILAKIFLHRTYACACMHDHARVCMNSLSRG